MIHSEINSQIYFKSITSMWIISSGKNLTMLYDSEES